VPSQSAYASVRTGNSEEQSLCQPLQWPQTCRESRRRHARKSPHKRAGCRLKLLHQAAANKVTNVQGRREGTSGEAYPQQLRTWHLGVPAAGSRWWWRGNGNGCAEVLMQWDASCEVSGGQRQRSLTVAGAASAASRRVQRVGTATAGHCRGRRTRTSQQAQPAWRPSFPQHQRRQRHHQRLHQHRELQQQSGRSQRHQQRFPP